MGGLIDNLTLFSSFACFGLSLWFAIYLLSRSRANPLAFRAILALVAMAFYYNYIVNAMVSGSVEKSPVRLFAQMVALVAWHDLTYYLLEPEQRKRRYTLSRLIVLLGVVMVVLIFTAPHPAPCDPAYLCPMSLQYPYPIILAFLGLVFLSILSNLWLVRKAGNLLPSTALYLAILIGIGPLTSGFLGIVLDFDVPRLLPNLFILTALILMAYSVAHDRALVVRRTTLYDLPVTLVTITVTVIAYVLIGRQLGLSGTDLLMIAVLVVFSHSAYDFVRDYLDQLFNREQRQVREEIDEMGRKTTTGESLQRYLSRALAILCTNLNASGGFIAIREDDQFVVVASLNSLPMDMPFPSREVVLEGFAQPTSVVFPGIAWLAPGHAGGEQTSVVGLGPRKDGLPYDEDDLYWLEDIAQEIGQIVHISLQPRVTLTSPARAQSAVPRLELNHHLSHGDLLSALAYKPDPALVECIEDAYQHLNDYDALGKSPLVALMGIQAADHLECGKLVHDRLLHILEKLRPTGQLPPEPLPKEWHAYMILYDSYVNDRQSRDIMGKLYIGEGTYYRLRRQALRGISRAVQERGAGV